MPHLTLNASRAMLAVLKAREGVTDNRSALISAIVQRYAQVVQHSTPNLAEKEWLELQDVYDRDRGTIRVLEDPDRVVGWLVLKTRIPSLLKLTYAERVALVDELERIHGGGSPQELK